jgi:hypothetical protein
MGKYVAGMTSSAANPEYEGTGGPLGQRDVAVEIRSIPIAELRADGETQHRIQLHASIVLEYAALMKTGVEFPPIRVWCDGANYWLTDGFHRVAAAQTIGRASLTAEILYGSLSEAQWDSYAANSSHGVRRTTEECRRIVRLALRHRNAARRSNVEIAKHLHIPEATLRRWRKSLSSPSDDDKERVVTRGESTYVLRTAGIGQGGSRRRSKSRTDLQTELASMKERSSPEIRRLLNIIGNWAFGRATAEASLEALERVAEEWGRPGTEVDASENHESHGSGGA